ncbi:hypothetical protein GW17_00003403 [Ensete ventricosum]|nr:hypothetical protein GW17_00003403 [Ensete ventricosum]
MNQGFPYRPVRANRREFESELYERFGSLVKMPLLKPDRSDFPPEILVSYVPFDFAVKQVLEQLRDVAKGKHKTPDTEKRKFGNIVFAAVTLPVGEIKNLLDKLAALEAQLGSINGEKIDSKNEWPHATLWTAPGTAPKEANTLPQLVSEGKATRIDIVPPVTVSGVLIFY